MRAASAGFAGYGIPGLPRGHQGALSFDSHGADTAAALARPATELTMAMAGSAFPGIPEKAGDHFVVWRCAARYLPRARHG